MNTECNHNTKIKMVLAAKKGMALKAMIKNIETDNLKNLGKQITKGTVIRIPA